MTAQPTLPESLVKALFLQRDLLAENNPKSREIRPVLIIEGGGTRGVCASAQTIGLLKLGLGDVFNLVIGYSAGAAIGAYALGGLNNLMKGTSLFHKELCERGFIRGSRFWKVEDVDLLISLFERGPKRLDVDSMRAHPASFRIAITRYQDGALEFRDGKSDKVFDLLRASAAIPLLYKPVSLDGSLYVDGGIAFDLEEAVQYAIDSVGATHVLILTNHSGGVDETTLPERVFMTFVARQIRDSYMKWHEHHERTLGKLLRRDDVVVGALHLPEEFAKVNDLSMDGALLKRVRDKSLKDTLLAFGR